MSERKTIYLCLAHMSEEGWEQKAYGSWLRVQGSWFRLLVMAYEKKSYRKAVKAEKASAYKPKRGKLAPLMKEDEKEKASIHELSFDFACRTTRLYQYLTEDAEYKENSENYENKIRLR